MTDNRELLELAAKAAGMAERPAEPVQEPVQGPLIGRAATDVPVPVYVLKKAEPVQEPDRAAFERHAESLGYSVDLDRVLEGSYWNSHTQLMWKTWQAAMAQRPAQPVQAPVGYWDGKFSDSGAAILYEVPQKSAFGFKYRNVPLYAAPLQRLAEPNTDEQEK